MTDWLNYHHLYYFWVIARHGSIARACEELRLAQPTLSAQLKSLEERLGQPLFERRQRKLLLTPTGRTVLNYAERIFRLGQELLDTVAERPNAGPRLVRIGVVDAVPKPVVFSLMKVLIGEEPLVRITVHEGVLENLVQELDGRQLDLVISDVSAPTDGQRPTLSRSLGRMPVGWVGSSVWRNARREFPQSLREIPVALPTSHSPLRPALDHWFSEQGIQPRVLAECQDAELLKRFALEDLGLAPVNLGAVAREIAAGLLIQIGPELAQEQLWMVVSARQPLIAPIEWLWSSEELEALIDPARE